MGSGQDHRRRAGSVAGVGFHRLGRLAEWSAFACDIEISQRSIVGQSKDAERIPLAGLSIGVKQTESAGGADVVVTVRGAGQMIQRREPLSYGAGAEAQTFAIMFSRARLAMQPVAPAAAAA